MIFCPNCRQEYKVENIVIASGIDCVQYGSCDCGWFDHIPICVPPNEKARLSMQLSNQDSFIVKSIIVDGVEISIGGIKNLDKNVHMWEAIYFKNGEFGSVNFDSKKISQLSFTTNTKFHGGFASINGIGFGSLGSNSQSNGFLESDDIYTVLQVVLEDGTTKLVKWDTINSWNTIDAVERIEYISSFINPYDMWLYVCPICKTRHYNEKNLDSEKVECSLCGCKYEGKHIRPHVTQMEYNESILLITNDFKQYKESWSVTWGAGIVLFLFLNIFWIVIYLFLVVIRLHPIRSYHIYSIEKIHELNKKYKNTNATLIKADDIPFLFDFPLDETFLKKKLASSLNA